MIFMALLWPLITGSHLSTEGGTNICKTCRGKRRKGVRLFLLKVDNQLRLWFFKPPSFKRPSVQLCCKCSKYTVMSINFKGEKTKAQRDQVTSLMFCKWQEVKQRHNPAVWSQSPVILTPTLQASSELLLKCFSVCLKFSIVGQDFIDQNESYKDRQS